MKQKFSNRLINESSPYLLQHAHNPVNWYPWIEEALQKAKDEDKVILVSIGYSACHWCHVMEKESFENEEVAKLMNEHFINIKIDREERPDLDHIYMDAVQAMTGSGGWPLNVFLTPDTKPFYGGTYFPPVRAHNRASWTEILLGINKSWISQREEIKTQAETLTGHLQRSTDLTQIKGSNPTDEVFTKEQCDTIFKHIMKQADTAWGGFGKAPKFPQTFTIQYLLQYHYFTGNKEALQQAVLSIDKMLEGGIYDHVGGGLARYSTDNEWLAPHFEKMLYDNALLINILCDVYQLTNDQQYEIAIRKTLDFAERELFNTSEGFYAAIDADSEGEEGKYYVWQKEEIDELLGVDSPLFCSYFDVTHQGNWEGKNILRILKKPGLFAIQHDLSLVTFETKIKDSLSKLMAARSGRIKPQTDDKILLGWNALMISALCKASAALGDVKYRILAEKTFNIILSNFKTGKNEADLYHTFKNRTAKYPAFLDDYACLIQSCINLQEITSDAKYLDHAKQFTEHVMENFIEEQTSYFFFSGKDQSDLIVRKKELYDGATPSGNSVMAENFFYLSIILHNTMWLRLSQQMTAKLSAAVVQYPSSFAIWAAVLQKHAYGLTEVAITGKDYHAKRDGLLLKYMPDKVLQCAGSGNEEFPLLKGKKFNTEALIYLCKNYSCQAPVKLLSDLILRLQK